MGIEGGARTRATRTREPGLMRCTIDGIPTTYRRIPGPARAVLAFRVGVMDEALHQRGLTHLVEHLALTRAPDRVHAFNGSTEALVTTFSVAGDDDEVVGFLDLVCSGLRDLALDRLEHERGVLRAEASTRTRFSGEDHLIWRFGAHGLARIAYPEYAVPVADADDVSAWARQHFHAGNCALWLSTAPPRGLRLDLGSLVGDRSPTPQGAGLPAVPLPAVHPRARPELVLSWTSQLADGGTALSALLADRLNRRLRHETGLAYGAVVTQQRLTASEALHLISVDATEATSGAVLSGALEVLRELREKPATAAELKRLTGLRALAADSSTSDLAHLDYWTRELLCGGKPLTQTESRERWSEISADLLAAAAERMTGSLLLGAADAEAAAEVGEVLPGWSPVVFDEGGTLLPHPSRTPEDAGVLTLSERGISWVRGQGAISVAKDECAVALRYSDGSLRLIADDGNHLWLAAEEWLGFDAVERWAAALPEGVLRPGGERTPRDLGPVPNDSTASAGKRTWSARVRGRVPRFAVLLVAVLVSAGLRQLLVPHGEAAPPPAPAAPVSVPLADAPSVVSAGGCFDDDSPPLPCSAPHRYQIIGVFLSTGRLAEDRRRCSAAFAVLRVPRAPFRVTAVDGDRLGAPLSAGTRQVACVVGRRDRADYTGALL